MSKIFKNKGEKELSPKLWHLRHTACQGAGLVGVHGMAKCTQSSSSYRRQSCYSVDGVMNNKGMCGATNVEIIVADVSINLINQSARGFTGNALSLLAQTVQSGCGYRDLIFVFLL